jgi:hypothetical protein
MDPETPPETTEPISTLAIETLLQELKTQQEAQHIEMVALTQELVASNSHIRALENNIMVGLGLLIAMIVLWKIVKIIF